ncbi:MAG: hypothetical protein ABEJ78_11890 [Haloferacaceae archaeon]
MFLTRRGVLALAGLGASGALSGCFGSGNDNPNASNGDDTSTPAATPTPTSTATPTPTPKPGPELEYPTLARRTSEVWAELDWFATEYASAMRSYVATVNELRTRLDELDVTTGISLDQVDGVQVESADLVDYVEKHLAPHFDVHPALLKADNVYVNNIRRGVRRGDREAQRSAVERARLFYQRVVSEPYIQNELSKRPIYDELYSKLLAPEAENHIFGLLYPDEGFLSVAHPDLTESTADDGVQQHTHEFPSGHVTYAHAHDHSLPHPLTDHRNDPEGRELYAYNDGSIAILEDTELWRGGLNYFEPLHGDVFAPVRHPDRAAAAYITINGMTSNFTSLPVYIQRFDSVAAARRARDELFRDPAGTSGTETLAERQWHRYFYQIGDVTMYAYLLTVGEFVLTAIPHPDSWERRTEEFGRLGGTWLGMPLEPPESESKSG